MNVIYIADSGKLYNELDNEDYLTLIPEYRLRKIQRYKMSKDKALSMAAGLLLRRALCDLLDKSFEDNTFTYKIVENEHGKPYLKDYPNVFFSISHSGCKVMCMISEYECGCDIQDVHKDIKENVYDMVLSENEMRIMDKLTKEQRPYLFTKIWTIKESIGKAIGVGMTFPMKELSVIIDKTENIEPSVDYDGKRYMLYDFPHEDKEYRCSYCIACDKHIDFEMRYVEI